MKKKVLLISESMGGGLRKHIVQLINNLNREKYEIYFIHGTKTMDSVFVEEYDSLKMKATIIPCETFTRSIDLKNDLKTLNFISKIIEEINPDIVHCHSSKAGAIGRIAARMKRVEKIFYTPHAYSFLSPEFSEKKRIMFIAIERFLSRHLTNMTFCVSKSEKEEAIKVGVDTESKIKVIYNGLPSISFSNRNRIRDELNLSSENFIIGNNARMTDQKNPELFFNIAKGLIEQNTNYHFVWAGSGPLLTKVKSFVEKNDLENNIHLLGDRQDSEIIVRDFDVFLITSNYEGFPYAPIEALRAGVPVVGTNVTGICEVINEKLNGYLFEKKKPQKAMEILERIYNGNILFDKDKIISSYKINYSQNEMIKKIDDYYSKQID
ncbi:glycosyltransferase [Candidatus Enterococcus murrayae]|uniref:Glycosyltransferase n=1 Tax=Candidatus Enterococcus murrayae TaxID=2815321 RepID=A0ABS3HHG8_9ENTE|nr:glycosyltransferase [Enterococcus sp. MJM16]MBO0452043.1 glycosyltransferase [Enterococcus sp. MJM16]